MPEKMNNMGDPPELVTRLLAEAVAASASDLFWIPGVETVTVRLKSSREVRTVAELPAEYGLQCVNRLKVLAGMLTYRTGVAQDGVIRDVPGLPAGAELRLASLPTMHGERISIRILDRKRVPEQLDGLGYAPDVLVQIRALLARPQGLVIMTGPTGSGKTTAMYAMLRELLATGADPASVVSIEDPVECEITGISQVQVTRSGEEWGYAQALRAALRHDVKTLLIGEMRDREIVRVALDAALTGHRILTTFHAGDVPSVYARLLHFGFEPFLVAAAVTGVMAQRLCQRQDSTSLIPVAAVLQARDEWRDFVLSNPGLDALRRQVRTMPGADLAQAAASLAAQGLITRPQAALLGAEAEPDSCK